MQGPFACVSQYLRMKKFLRGQFDDRNYLRLD